MQIAFLELIIDPACSIVFESEQIDPTIMDEPPRGLGEPMFSRRVLTIAALQGLSALAAVLAVYQWTVLSGRPGESGPVITLSGETDMTVVVELSELVTGQLAAGTRQLRIDVSGLRFADSASIRTLVLVAKTLKERVGSLVLVRPQQPVARVLALMGADLVVTIRRPAE